MPKEIQFSQSDIATVGELYRSGASCIKIGKQFNCSKQTINKLLCANKIELRDSSHAHQKYQIDENIFEQIDTQEKAYWLGMLTGDGWITDRNEFGLSLEENDNYLIYKFREFLKSNHPIVRKINRPKKDGSQSISYELRITNQKVVADLIKYSFKPNKTLGMEFPKISDEFLSNYILGLVDSDGSFCLKKRYNNPNIKTLSFSFVGPTEFVEKFQNILIQNCMISKTKLDQQKNTDFIRIVNYGGYKNIYKIVKFLYSNPTIWMERKKNIAINYLLTKYPNDQWLLDQSQNTSSPQMS